MKKEKKNTCQAGLKKNIISKEVFERETKLCRQLAKDNKGKCCWGVCAKCGVIPLLVKLHQGKLLEDPGAIQEEKRKYFSS